MGKETSKAKELQGEMESDDEDLKKKREAKWDPKKYFLDLQDVRDGLMNSRLFNDKAYDVLEEWKKRHEAAIDDRVAAKAVELKARTKSKYDRKQVQDIEKIRDDTERDEIK